MRPPGEGARGRARAPPGTAGHTASSPLHGRTRPRAARRPREAGPRPRPPSSKGQAWLLPGLRPGASLGPPRGRGPYCAEPPCSVMGWRDGTLGAPPQPSLGLPVRKSQAALGGALLGCRVPNRDLRLRPSALQPRALRRGSARAPVGGPSRGPCSRASSTLGPASWGKRGSVPKSVASWALPGRRARCLAALSPRGSAGPQTPGSCWGHPCS